MKNLVILLFALVPAACTSQEAPVALDSTPAPAANAVVEQAEYTVSCGCKLDSVGHCGNYVDIDGAWLEIANADVHGLGVMEWCSVPEANAEVAGEIEDGKFVATVLKVIG
jgi:hypothetical protein